MNVLSLVTPPHKGYKRLSKDGRLYISKDAQFNELKFPFAESKSAASPPSSQPVSTQITCPMPLIIVQQPSVTPAGPSHDFSSPNMSQSDHNSQSGHIFGHSSNCPHADYSPLTTDSPLLPSLHSGFTPQYGSSVSNTTSPVSNTTSSSSTPAQTTNQHPMVTRSKSKLLTNSLPLVLLTQAEPTSPKQALAIPQWKQAMQLEYDALIANGTWTLVDLPPRRQSIGCKWVFRIKENPDGTINKYKARLVAKGFIKS